MPWMWRRPSTSSTAATSCTLTSRARQVPREQRVAWPKALTACPDALPQNPTACPPSTLFILLRGSDAQGSAAQCSAAWRTRPALNHHNPHLPSIEPLSYWDMWNPDPSSHPPHTPHIISFPNAPPPNPPTPSVYLPHTHTIPPSQNVLLTRDYACAKLGDVGWAQILYRSYITGDGGTFNWAVSSRGGSAGKGSIKLGAGF